GKIVPEDEHKIYADAENGEIKEFKVEENQQVKEGDALFVYDESRLENEYNAAVRARDMINNNSEAVQNQINQLTKQMEQMKKEMNKEASAEEGVFITDEDIRQIELEKNQLQLERENIKAD